MKSYIREKCHWCKKTLSKKSKIFCSDTCSLNYWKKYKRVRRRLRLVIFYRDRGICNSCGMDTIASLKELQARRPVILRRHKRAIIRRARERGECCSVKPLTLTQWWNRFLIRLGGKTLQERWRQSIWTMDHVRPKHAGGHHTSLDNIQTLCIWCHDDKNLVERQEIYERRTAKKSLGKSR